MIGDIARFGEWWAWWSNPARGIHDDHRFLMALTPEDMKRIDYFRLLELRSAYELQDVPDPLVQAMPEWQSVPWINDTELFEHFWQLGVLTLDTGVLQFTIADWAEAFDVQNADLIRNLVRIRSELPVPIRHWQDEFSRNLTQTLKNRLAFNERIRLSMLIFLKSYLPRLAQRWRLTCSKQVTDLARKFDPMPDEAMEVMLEWIKPSLDATHAVVKAQFDVPEIDMSPDPELDFDLDEADAMLGEGDHV